ncbi:site-specific DNA-methyltransferase [Vibrio parahaemolyticus]|nr:site-specific DNA-methyltransferase [Vibrio parahaemolyticus]EIY6180892.1 site-specific DNA-methyltransferase [Vibrio parahaemolyticus]EKM6950145.1 site-specific DNA-methyltransferase [Vibrio parahaemolyticus]ELA9353352.1 site-specific DNA-methyltransferase [Vibrio parahaemolyticus]ELA9588158.1 site-specific DNA-methyltransferase [Vibrio parahaemolyticus]
MDKLKMHSPNLVDQNVDKLAQLFPNCITEAKGEDGKLRKAIDFDQLKQELSRNIVEGPQERYQLNWPGKREALLTANAPIAKTLRPCREESVNFDTTENLFIEGDNLDALKLLQETYLGKVKMIYIDPPYNTGKDFIYGDDFAENTELYLAKSFQKDDHGNRLKSNEETSGRFHSDWLSMIYPRIKLAYNLLSDDGVIFISINHKELSNLKNICDEIFNKDNLLCLFSWRTDGNFDNQAKFKYCHEYILAYAKNEESFPAPLVVDPNTPKGSKIFNTEIRNTIVKNGPKNPVSDIVLPKGFPCAFEEGVLSPRSDSWPMFSIDIQVENWAVTSPVAVSSGWSSKELALQFIDNNCKPVLDAKGQMTSFVLTKTGAIEAIKTRGEPSHVISSLTGLGGPQKAFNEVTALGVIFDDYPKPVDLIKYFISMNRGNDFTVLDFFAGSGTTAHAVMNANANDNGLRKFITVQLDEDTNPKSQAHSKGFMKISDISKARIKSAGEKVALENQTVDCGFRVLKISTTNMAEVYYSPDSVSQADLFAQVDNVKEDRTEEDLLFQVMLDWGVDLTLPIRRETIDGNTVFFVADNALVACFDKSGNITESFVKQLAEFEPIRLVFRDAGFASDSTKINVEQVLKQLSPITDVKSI